MPRLPNPHPYKKTITRWRLPDGREAKRGTPGSIKSTEHSSTYYADISGKTIALKTTDLGIAWKRLRDKLREQHQRDLGVRDQYSEHAREPLLGHLGAWIAILQAKGTGHGQRETIEKRLRKLFAMAGWTKLAHITMDSATHALADLQEKEGRSAQTRNHYVTHLRGFCAWLVLTGRLPANPVLELRKANVETDRRRRRREPTREEIGELFRWLEGPAAPRVRGMTGPQRALAYKTAMATGYRANELRALTVESFDLAARTVSLPAAEDKRRRADVHPLPDWLVTELQKWFAAGGDAWDAFPSHRPGRVLRGDMRMARKSWIAAGHDPATKQQRKESAFLAYRIDTADGPTYLDFHSLRVFYLSELAALPNMDLKTLMVLARHSTPQLSLSIYAKAREANIRAATDQLRPPDLPRAPVS